jgi:hypothetical protein
MRGFFAALFVVSVYPSSFLWSHVTGCGLRERGRKREEERDQEGVGEENRELGFDLSFFSDFQYRYCT